MTTKAARNTTENVSHADHSPGTRRRLLDAAAELFATRGYRSVAVRDICERACANVAAVNYHFGGKDKLHAAAIEHARERALREDLAPAASTPAGPMTPQQKLHRQLHGMFSRAFANGPAGWYMQIVLREMVDPSPALKQTIDDNIAPYLRKLEAIIGQLLRQEPDSHAVKDLVSCIVATAVYFQSCRASVEHLRPGFAFDQPCAERLTDLMTAMVMHTAAPAA